MRYHPIPSFFTACVVSFAFLNMNDDVFILDLCPCLAFIFIVLHFAHVDFMSFTSFPSGSGYVALRKVPPPNMSPKVLLERDAAVRDVIMCMIGETGQEQTAFLDDMHGSGKTSLISNLVETGKALGWHLRSEKFRELARATYLHIRMDVHWDGNVSIDKKKMSSIVRDAIRSVVRTASDGQADLPLNESEFMVALDKVCGSQKLILHFDEVGCFESTTEHAGYATAMIYEIWNMGTKLKAKGHYFALTGRSSLLHIVGTGKLQNSTYRSPHTSKLISLAPLSSEAVLSLMEERIEFTANTIEEAAAIREFTGGIPRAVVEVIRYVANQSVVFTKLSEPQIEDITSAVQQSCCRVPNSQDSRSFDRCLEMSWCAIEFSDRSTICGEPITCLIARLGIFREEMDKTSGRFKLLIPKFMRSYQHKHSRLIEDILKDRDIGNRMECAFLRILHLRLTTQVASEPVDWSSIDLPAISSLLNPPPCVIDSTRMFAAPKIASSGWTKEEVVETMGAIHNNNVLDSLRATFPPDALPCIFECMFTGHLYVPLPKSSSADLFIKLAADCMLCFQFKNSSTNLTKEKIETEAKKCTAAGWNVMLVLVCSSGNGTASDKWSQIEGVQVLHLSKTSVEKFLGSNTISKMTSTTALQDLSIRLAASPLKLVNLEDLANTLSGMTV